MIIKLFVMSVCAGLNWYGGYRWHNARRFIMPTGIAAFVSFSIHSWWGLTCLMAIAPLCVGYGEKSILWKYFNDAWGRFIWMVLVSTSFCLGLILLHHLNIFIGLGYIIGNGILGMTLRKYNQIIGDVIFGLGLSSFILFLKG